MPVTNGCEKVTSDIGGGRYYVVRRHFDQDSKVGFFTWSGVPEQDIDAVVAARVVESTGGWQTIEFGRSSGRVSNGDHLLLPYRKQHRAVRH